MRGVRRAGKSFLIVSALLLVMVALAPATPMAPAWARAARPTASQKSLAPVERSKITLGEMSVDGPALWTSNPGAPRLGLASVLAWTGTDPNHSLNVLESSDGLTYGDKLTFAESSATRPAVAAIGAPPSIVLAWTGTDANHSLNLLCRGTACGPSMSSVRKLTLIDSSFSSPALTRFGNGFLLVWAGTDAHRSLNALPFSLTTGGSGFALGAKRILWQFGSAYQPSVALNPHNNQLLLSWTATSPAGALLFATSGDGVNWSGAQALPNESSSAGPQGYAVAASDIPTCWMTFTSNDPAHAIYLRFTSSFPQWPLANSETRLSETAFGGPALGYVGDSGRMLLAWTGTDTAHHINLAVVTTATVPTLDQRIDAYISGLSTTQLIGQTLMVAVYASGYNANLDQAISQWQIGSAIVFTNYNGGPLQPATLAGLQQLTQALQSHAHLPLLLALDEEGGTVDRLAAYYGSTPSARQLAATGNPLIAYQQAQTDASRMRANGFNVDFAPVADVDQGGGIGSSRTFGTSPGVVTTYAGAFLDGLQQHGVAGTLKHWPGLGAATGNPDFTLPTINQSQAQMNALDFAPFRALLSHQPGMVMVTTVLAPAYDASRPAMLSPTLVNGVLRGQLGYQGVIVTDALDAQGLIAYMRQQGYTNIVQGLGEASVRAFLAGNDLIEAPIEQDRLAAVVAAMTQAVQSGRISQARLRASVHRIIRLKVELGLITLP